MNLTSQRRTKKEYRDYCIRSIERGKDPLQFEIWLPGALKKLLLEDLPKWLAGGSSDKFKSRTYVLYMEDVNDISPNVKTQLDNIVEGVADTRFMFDLNSEGFRVSKCDSHDIFILSKEEKDLKGVVDKFLKDFNSFPNRTAILDIDGRVERLKLKAKFYVVTSMESVSQLKVYWKVVK